ncbi:MAG: hypothetical protein J5966_01240, partial [Lachnospiraceae bacterium]|nr:hypothetical protein [Lachnospiraceae bacterium]
MEFAARCELLSTYNAYGRFETGEDGFPVLKGDYLTVPDSFTLTSIAEIKSDIVDEDGNVTEKDAELKKGEKLTLYRTDGNETVDATLSDGRIVRFKVTGSNYPHKVNGVIDEDKLFEGLFYSG